MISCNSISGGQTSAYIAANYPANYNLFSLVTTKDKKCIYPDPGIRKFVSDKIGKEFIGTLEDDKIIKTIIGLEQFIGTPITWVSGITFDEVVQTKGGWLPNKLHRYCTIEMKDIKVGDKVHYKPSHAPPNFFEKGVVKSIGRSRDSVFVVYHCNDDWDNYENYTAALTSLDDLHPDWSPEENRVKESLNLLKKYTE